MNLVISMWLISGIIIFSFICFLGLRINGRALGILIDSRSKMSLSRFQLILWTTLFTSTILTAGFFKKDINIEIEGTLWALLGISVASTAGSTLIKGTKSDMEPKINLSEQSSDNPIKFRRIGLLHANIEQPQASFLDIFKGEEISNYEYIDVSKVQMFIFTIVIWLAYFASLFIWLQKGNFATFPLLSESMVTFLGISHVGYLTTKAVPKQ